jgi:TonB family protein
MSKRTNASVFRAASLCLALLVPTLALGQPSQDLQQTTSGGDVSQTGRTELSSAVSSGLLVRKVQPNYPPLAQQARIQGAVVLQAVIGKDGSVKHLRAISGHPMLVQSAVEAVRQWQYKPYLLKGEAVEVDTQVTVSFSLAGGKKETGSESAERTTPRDTDDKSTIQIPTPAVVPIPADFPYAPTWMQNGEKITLPTYSQVHHGVKVILNVVLSGQRIIVVEGSATNGDARSRDYTPGGDDRYRHVLRCRVSDNWCQGDEIAVGEMLLFYLAADNDDVRNGSHIFEGAGVRRNLQEEMQYFWTDTIVAERHSPTQYGYTIIAVNSPYVRLRKTSSSAVLDLLCREWDSSDSSLDRRTPSCGPLKSWQGERIPLEGDDNSDNFRDYKDESNLVQLAPCSYRSYFLERSKGNLTGDVSIDRVCNPDVARRKLDAVGKPTTHTNR